MVRDKGEELNRIFPDIKETDGIINLNICVLFPYTNVEVLTFGFGLVNDSVLEDVNDDREKWIYKDFIMNHRYPNKEFLTVSQKVGKKVSGIGYSIVGDIKTLNTNRMLIMKIGIGDKYMWLCFPLDFELTKVNPYISLECCIHHFENLDEKKFGIDFKIPIPKEKYAASHIYYQLGTNKFGNDWVKEKVNERDFKNLYPIAEDRETMLIGFGPAIKLNSFSKQNIWLL